MWSFFLKEKIRVGLLLASVMCLIVVSSVLAKRDIRTISSSFSSIYSDRLLPATDLFYLSEHLLTRRMVLEQFLFSGHPVEENILREKLNTHNQVADSLLNAFQMTLLVDQETKYLDQLKKAIQQNRLLEDKIISLSAENRQNEARELFNNASSGNLLEAIADLNHLVHIQSDIGRDLVKSSENAASSINMIAVVQIAVCIIVGIIVQVILLGAKLIPFSRQPFHYN
jgi:CHASE3 domain sensor protein